MIEHLLEHTLELRRERFEPLIVEVVRSGLTYRAKQENPITPKEIEKINGLILEIGFKFPDLWDPDFIASLHADGTTRASERVKRAKVEEGLKESQKTARSQDLEKLKNEFLALHSLTDRQAAGLKLEKILNQLFGVHKLAPREPFRVTGEQIDGSFQLDYEIYLMEAKWHREPRPAADLYVFREKIEGKSKFTRGVFLSVNGVTDEAKEAITHGKQPNFFIIDGYDLMMLLEDNIDLGSFLRQRQRLLAEDGRVCVPFLELVR
jgi:restriction endonuclease Mrr